DTASRTSGRLAIVDGNLRNPGHNRSAAGPENQDREVPEREKIGDQRSLDTNQLGISPCRIPQKTRIPGDATRRTEIAAAASCTARIQLLFRERTANPSSI